MSGDAREQRRNVTTVGKNASWPVVCRPFSGSANALQASSQNAIVHRSQWSSVVDRWLPKPPALSLLPFSSLSSIDGAAANRSDERIEFLTTKQCGQRAAATMHNTRRPWIGRLPLAMKYVIIALLRRSFPAGLASLLL